LASHRIERQPVSGAKALAATVVLMIVTFTSVPTTGPLVLLAAASPHGHRTEKPIAI
jgi:hypothetical protein